MSLLRTILGFSLFTLVLSAQQTAVLTGRVSDVSGAGVPTAQVSLRNDVSRFERSVVLTPAGEFRIQNIPFGSYDLVVNAPGFQTWRQTFNLRTAVPQEALVKLEIGAVSESVIVAAADSRVTVDPEATGTQVQMNRVDMEKLAAPGGNRGVESVLVTMPGFAQNANGTIHPRGAHNQMTLMVDGMPISDQSGAAFGNTVDTAIADTVELYTGNIPAEFGSKVSAVAAITTRSGYGSGRRFGGTTSLQGGGFDTLSQTTSMFGESGRFGFSGNVTTNKSNRYLDSVSLDNLHNGGNSQRGFARLDFMKSERNTFRLNVMAGRSSFQQANLRSQHANLMNQRMALTDNAFSFNWTSTLSPRSVFETTTSLRNGWSRMAPSAGDTPVTAFQDRRQTTFTTGARFSTVQGRHNIRSGVDIQTYPLREDFRFGITDNAFNVPGTEDYNPSLLRHDLTRGGQMFRFNASDNGGLYSAFLQDSITMGRWRVSLGMRYDIYRFLSGGNQWQPRVGVSYHIRETGTVLRASYNRLYQTPPIENLLLSSSAVASSLAPPAVAAAFGAEVLPLRPERQNFYEVGFQQAVTSRFSVQGSYYHKNARDQQDNNNFFNTGVIFPVTLQQIRVNGAEGRIVMLPWKGLGFTTSFTHARAITTPPFTGGLFVGNEAVDLLSAGPFLIDHDQTLAVHNVVNYTHRSGFYSMVSVRYDSGLVANPSDPAEVAADPDYADLLPYVRLNQQPASRVAPRTITDVVLGFEKKEGGKRRWDASLQMTNLFNQTALYNFQSIFVGTRVVAPRVAAVRLRWFF
jgi:hypothetical protein